MLRLQIHRRLGNRLPLQRQRQLMTRFSSASAGDAGRWLDEGRLWVDRDPNAETRGAVQQMVDQEDTSGLEAILGSRLQVGFDFHGFMEKASVFTLAVLHECIQAMWSCSL